MKLAIIGASGNVGAKIVTEALSRHHTVTAIARNVEKIESKPGQTVTAADATDQAAIAGAVAGNDVVIVSVRFDRTDMKAIFEGIRASGVKRILVVGGAASLYNQDNVRLIDTPGFPDFIKVEATPAAAALDWMRTVTDLDWSFVSPSMFLAPGERTGNFRLGKDHLLVAENGESKISQEDLSMALIDEAETPKHIRQRFTVGY